MSGDDELFRELHAESTQETRERFRRAFEALGAKERARPVRIFEAWAAPSEAATYVEHQARRLTHGPMRATTPIPDDGPDRCPYCTRPLASASASKAGIHRPCAVSERLDRLAQADPAAYVQKIRDGALAVIRREERRLKGRPVRQWDDDEQALLDDLWDRYSAAVARLSDLAEIPDDAIRRELLGGTS